MAKMSVVEWEVMERAFAEAAAKQSARSVDAGNQGDYLMEREHDTALHVLRNLWHELDGKTFEVEVPSDMPSTVPSDMQP